MARKFKPLVYTNAAGLEARRETPTQRGRSDVQARAYKRTRGGLVCVAKAYGDTEEQALRLLNRELKTLFGIVREDWDTVTSDGFP